MNKEVKRLDKQASDLVIRVGLGKLAENSSRLIPEAQQPQEARANTR